MPRSRCQNYGGLSEYVLRSALCLLAITGLDFQLVHRFVFTRHRNGVKYTPDEIDWEVLRWGLMRFIADVPAETIQSWGDDAVTPWPRALVEATRFHRYVQTAGYVRLRNMRHGAPASNRQVALYFNNLNAEASYLGARLGDVRHPDPGPGGDTNTAHSWRRRFRRAFDIRYRRLRTCEPQGLGVKREKAILGRMCPGIPLYAGMLHDPTSHSKPLRKSQELQQTSPPGLPAPGPQTPHEGKLACVLTITPPGDARGTLPRRLRGGVLVLIWVSGRAGKGVFLHDRVRLSEGARTARKHSGNRPPWAPKCCVKPGAARRPHAWALV